MNELKLPSAPVDEAVRIFVQFPKIDNAIKGFFYCSLFWNRLLEFIILDKFVLAVVDLNGRYFGGRLINAGFHPLDRFQNLDLNP